MVDFSKRIIGLFCMALCAGLSQAQVSDTKKKSAEEAPVIQWISEHAIPLNTVEAGNGFEDLRPIQEMIGEARIVSLGEPTHGNREVFQLKHRLIEYLVTEMGFHLFALECPFGEAFDVNQYILDGKGTPEEALAGIYYWAWDTQEVVALLEWMRAYNADPSHTTKVRFYGFDVQDPERAARYMLEYLQKVDPQLTQEVLPELDILQIPFSEPNGMGRRPYIPEEYDEGGWIAIKRVMKAFDDQKERYVSATNMEEYELALHHARQVEIWIDACINDGAKYNVLREMGQAQNLQWIMDREGSDAKMIVWAHNSHVSSSTRNNDVEMMGSYLKKMYGDALKIFGIFFNQGGFWALDVDVPSKGMDNFSVGPAPEGTLEHTLATAGHEISVLDMDRLPSEGSVRDWFYTKIPTRNSGAGYNRKTPERYFWSYTPAEAFDALILLDRTTPTKVVNPSDFEVIWMVDYQLERPMNLDFESNQAGELPDGWLVWTKFERIGARFEVTSEQPYEGKRAVSMHRPEGVTFGELTPNLTQTIDATPYRGKKIRVRAATRSEVKEPGFAFFRLFIEADVLQSAHDGQPPLFDSLDEFRIPSSDWKVLTIEADVSQAANTLNYGIYLRDFGTVWLDAVVIEVVE